MTTENCAAIHPSWLARKAACAAIALVSLAAAGAAASPWPLVTDEELARERAYDEQNKPGGPQGTVPQGANVLRRSLIVPRGGAFKAPPAAAPVIDWEAPKLDQPVKSPVSIRIAFKPAPGAEIVPDSFKVLYGFLKIDVTARILEHVHPTREGLSVDEAAIPQGRHNFILQVRDTQERQGETDVNLVVE
jgi:hypothetical protein